MGAAFKLLQNREIMSNPLSENWQFTTLSIEDDEGRLGTGFLVADTKGTTNEHGFYSPDWSSPLSRAYLVTARHVLGNNESVISTTLRYTIRYNARTPRGLEARPAEFEIRSEPANYSVHPDADIDVAALDVTEFIAELRDAHLRFCPLSELANPVSLLDTACDAGDDVFVLGYPLTLRQGASNLPLIRKGVLATSPRRPLIDGNRRLRGFLIDGAIMPGSSGSPVVSSSGRFLPGDLAVTPNRPLLLGLVVQEWGRGELERYQTRIAAATGNDLGGYANLGFAQSASAIIETIARLGHHDLKEFLRVDHDTNWSPHLGILEWALDSDPREVDPAMARRIIARLHRDRLRAEGRPVVFDDYYDVPDIMGPVSHPVVTQLPKDPLIDAFRQRGFRV